MGQYIGGNEGRGWLKAKDKYSSTKVHIPVTITEYTAKAMGLISFIDKIKLIIKLLCIIILTNI